MPEINIDICPQFIRTMQKQKQSSIFIPVALVAYLAGWMKKIPAEILFLSAFYLTCLEIVKITVFYGMLKCLTEYSYKAK